MAPRQGRAYEKAFQRSGWTSDESRHEGITYPSSEPCRALSRRPRLAEGATGREMVLQDAGA